MTGDRSEPLAVIRADRRSAIVRDDESTVPVPGGSRGSQDRRKTKITA